MLYVPLFFYIFDRLKERGERTATGDASRPADAGTTRAAAAPPGRTD
jgi:hypothetical protein